MKRILESIDLSLKHKNYVAALMQVLTLPDICGKIDFPKDCTGKRYREWIEKNLNDIYTLKWKNWSRDYKLMGSPDNIIPIKIENDIAEIQVLEKDCIYKLRNAVLHQGETNPEIVLPYELIFINDKNKHFHINYFPTTKERKLLIDTETFCKNICNAVSKWNRTRNVHLDLNVE